MWRRRGDVGPSRRDCGDACAASGECALLRGSKLLVFAEADQPMEQDREQDQGLSPHHMLFAKGLRWDWGNSRRLLLPGAMPGAPGIACAARTSTMVAISDVAIALIGGRGGAVATQNVLKPHVEQLNAQTPCARGNARGP